MKRFFKILAWVVGSLFALLVVAAIVVPMVVDLNDYRDQLSALAKKQTGRELTIEGKIKLSLFPWFGLEIGKVTMGNAPGFGPAPFARIGDAEVKVKLLPLLHKKVETDRIVLRGVAVNLARQADGVTNWSDLMKAPAATAAPAPQKGAPAPKGGAAGNALGALAIGGLELRDASVSWDDRMTGARYAISHLNLVSGAVRIGQPFAVNLEFDADSNKPAVSGHIKFASRITLNLADQRFRLDATDLAAELHGKLLAGGKAALTLHSNIALDLPAQRYQLDGTALTADLEGKLAPGGKVAATLHGDIAANLKAQTLRLAALKLSALGVDLQGEVQGTRIIDAPNFSGRLQSAAFVPQDVAKQLGVKLPPMADPSALTKAAFSFGFDAGLDHAALSNLVLQLDDTKLTGQASVRDFKRPVIRYDLNIDQVDADRYLPPPPPKPVKATPAAAGAAAAVQLPLPLLRSLDIQGTVKVGKLKVMNLHSAALYATVNAKDGLFHIHPVGAQLYGGSYQGNLTLDVRGNTPISAMDEKLAGVQVGPLLKDFMGKDYVTGTANISAKMTAHGIDPLAVRKSLNGSAAFSFVNGAVNGINIGQLLRNAYAAYKKLPPPKEETKKTDFGALSGTVKVTNGLVRNDDLSAKSPLLRVSGKGAANLVTEAIDYRVEAGVTGSFEGQGGKSMDELKGTQVPIHISGTFSAPKFDVDVKSILDARVKKAVAEEKKKQEKRLRQNIENDLKKKLKGMIKF